MYAAGRGAARLLLVAAFVAAAVARQPRQPRSKPARVYRPNKDAAKLLDYVMVYEKQWTDVLKEPIRLLDEPPHKGRAFKAPPAVPRPDADALVDKELPPYDVRDIVARVTRHYGAVRSFVEYGAKAVRRALACYTFKQVIYQTSTIVVLMEKESEPNVVLQAANALKKNTASFIDTLSAVPDDDLSILLRAYWQTIKVLQHDGIQHLDKEPYPKELMETTKNFNLRVGKFIGEYCMPYPTEEDFFRITGIPNVSPLIKDPSIDSIMDINETSNIAKAQAKHMALAAKSLEVCTMSNHLWTSLFFYRGVPRLDSTKLDVSAPEKKNAEPPTSEAGPSTSDAGPSTSEADPS